MGSWNYQNIGVSIPAGKKHYVETIFKYLGYSEEPENGSEMDGERIHFEPDLYVCAYSENRPQEFSEESKCLKRITETDLLYLLCALFPDVKLYSHKSNGNDTTDTWVVDDKLYDTATMTLQCMEAGSFGFDEEDFCINTASWKERFKLKSPNLKYVDALMRIGAKDGNDEFAALMSFLSMRICEGMSFYTEDPSDMRKTGEAYDIEGDISLFKEFNPFIGEEESETETDDVPETQAEIVTFGHYPQSKLGGDNSSIEWFVLKKMDGKALVISRHGLVVEPFHEYSSNISWANCSLRSWLNSTFLNAAFSEEEQTRILTMDIDNHNSEGEGNITQDKVHLLSWTEIDEFFKTPDEMRCAPTDYAKLRGSEVSSCKKVNGRDAGRWWVRCVGFPYSMTFEVTPFGEVSLTNVDSDNIMVRPALWIKLKT